MNRSPDIEAIVTLLRTEDGGRLHPVYSGYRPQHKVRDDYQTSAAHQYLDHDQVAPGDTARATITFITPEVYPHCLWVGREILIQEGSKVVGTARVIKIMNPLLEKEEGSIIRDRPF